ncbi:hypothetical protein J5226_08000 [Lysobacter sp. K5869]|uniref:hypothetical protein n=1 Tax=Lysobacter sp. K5869 TaxID=2820808 RepID=UPI001C0643B0|nr:hypothetical protein [Lysobacter sp. K5869]QWP78322.1 hypothetical protein J5226_08000 [Lysobacter sp. K5869]
MLTSSDLIQALRPAFIVYALAMASTGAALRFAPDDARQAAARTPAALRWVQRAERAFGEAAVERPVASVARAAAPLQAGLRAHADTCARVAAEALPAPAAAAHGAFVAGALAALP